MAGWTDLKQLIFQEVIQMSEEGFITDGFNERISACSGSERDLMEIYIELREAKSDPDYKYIEPDELSDILALSGATLLQPFQIDPAVLDDKMYGAWLGRCIGCALGKPFETDPFVCGTSEAAGWRYIRNWLEGANAYPLNDYVPGNSSASDSGLKLVCEASHKENISFMETDDDIRYLVIGLLIAEKYDNDFTPEQVMEIWHQYLPARQCCTAELQAYINGLCTEITDLKTKREYIRTHLNPYREWIGAQIRADQYGYVNAGDPLSAAKAAYNDAAFTHVKNGIYGAMFTAALISVAFVEDSIDKCIETALSVIPASSRLYEDISCAIQIAKAVSSEDELYGSLWKEFGRYDWVHTNNNACACVAALVFGKGDFTRTVTTAVCCGWDTDCNGATVGSVIGAFIGAKAIPGHWKEPLNDTLYSFIPGFHPISINECSGRSVKVFNKLHTRSIS
ncbi:MAG: ADP-ribosylglycohydrolase family protein [Candidatus Delongbacteria bacterium]